MKHVMRQHPFFSLISAAIALVFAVSLAALATMPLEAGALGVSSPFLEKNTMELAEDGGSAMFTITLQNVDEEDVPVKVDVSSNGDIARIVDPKDVYILPAGSVDTKVTINITVPDSARVGDVYEVRYSVKPLTSEPGGIVSLLPGVSLKFKVKIEKNSDKFYLGYYLQETGKMWVVIILIVIAYAAYRIHKRKKGKHGKKLLFR
ncbi:hypothetical protein HYU16_01865 [Candidatus Woesearchaeota archaeon]|nr:hypothetical protein [Candidatus Woesearchaeota archaeon]MBI2550174.1 hypothetical protein [Candidatus Woesearchaeota archaeon]